MTRTTGFRLFLLAGWGMLPASAARAQDDTQFWLVGNANVAIAPGVAGTIDTSHRWREGADQTYLRGNVDFKVADHISIGGGAGYVDYAGGHEFRPHQQATATFGHIALRTRLEERFFAGNDRAQIRLRQRLRAAFPVAAGTEAAFTAEAFVVARGQTAATREGLEQLRFGGFLTHRLTRTFDAGLGYLLIDTVRPGAPDRFTHVPQVVFSARL